MYINKTKFFRLEDDQGGGFGGSADPDSSGYNGGGDQSQQTPQTPAFDVKQLASEFGNQLKTIFPAQQQQEPQISPEEAKRRLNMWEPDDAFLQEFGNMETQKTALLKLRDGLFKQFYTVMQMHSHEMRQQMEQAYEQKYGSVLSSYQQEQAAKQQERFGKAFPELANPAMQPIVEAVANSLLKAGKRYTKETELFTDLAKGVEAVIQQSNPEFKLSVKQPGNAGGLPVTTPGNRGGGSAKSAAQLAGKPKAVQLLG